MAFGVDHNISTRTNKKIIEAKFEICFQSINRYVNEIPVNKVTHLNERLRSICDIYNHIHAPYKVWKLVEKVSRTKDIIVPKQSKSKGVLVIGKMY